MSGALRPNRDGGAVKPARFAAMVVVTPPTKAEGWRIAIYGQDQPPRKPKKRRVGVLYKTKTP